MKTTCDTHDGGDVIHMVIPENFNRVERAMLHLLDHFDRLVLRCDRAARRRKTGGVSGADHPNRTDESIDTRGLQK